MAELGEMNEKGRREIEHERGVQPRNANQRPSVDTVMTDASKPKMKRRDPNAKYS
jgi:hypothetical protein